MAIQNLSSARWYTPVISVKNLSKTHLYPWDEKRTAYFWYDLTGSQMALTQNYQTSQDLSKFILKSIFWGCRILLLTSLLSFLQVVFPRPVLLKWSWHVFKHAKAKYIVIPPYPWGILSKSPTRSKTEDSPELFRPCSGICLLQYCHRVPELICPSTLYPLVPLSHHTLAISEKPECGWNTVTVRLWQVIKNRDSCEVINAQAVYTAWTHWTREQLGSPASWEKVGRYLRRILRRVHNSKLGNQKLFLSRIFHLFSESEWQQLIRTVKRKRRSEGSLQHRRKASTQEPFPMASKHVSTFKLSSEPVLSCAWQAMVNQPYTHSHCPSIHLAAVYRFPEQEKAMPFVWRDIYPQMTPWV